MNIQPHPAIEMDNTDEEMPKMPDIPLTIEQNQILGGSIPVPKAKNVEVEVDVKKFIKVWALYMLFQPTGTLFCTALFLFVGASWAGPVPIFKDLAY